MKALLAQHITPRITSVTAIKYNTTQGRITVGYSGRCDCGKREDHIFQIDGNTAYDKAVKFVLNHVCTKNATPWAGNLSK